MTKTAGENPAKARRNEGASVEKIPNTEDVKGGEQTTWTQVLGRKQKAEVKKQQRQEKKENQIASTVSSKKTDARKDDGSSNANSSKMTPGKSN